MDAFLSTVAGVAVGGVATYTTQWGVDRRREKREAVQAVAQLYDNAITAVATVEAARWGPGTRVDATVFPSADEEQRKALMRQLDGEAVQRFVRAKQNVRTALVALHPHSDDLRRFWDKSEAASEAEFGELMALLAERRTALVRTSVCRWQLGWPRRAGLPSGS